MLLSSLRLGFRYMAGIMLYRESFLESQSYGWLKVRRIESASVAKPCHRHEPHLLLFAGHDSPSALLERSSRSTYPYVSFVRGFRVALWM